MEDLRVFISESFFLDLTSLEEVRQGISCNISLSLIIIDLEVVLRDFLGPIDLVRVQVFYIHELTEVIIVDKDKDLVFAAFQVVTPSLQGFNNSEKLLIVGFVLSLSKDHFLREKGY